MGALLYTQLLYLPEGHSGCSQSLTFTNKATEYVCVPAVSHLHICTGQIPKMELLEQRVWI